MQHNRLTFDVCTRCKHVSTLQLTDLLDSYSCMYHLPSVHIMLVTAWKTKIYYEEKWLSPAVSVANFMILLFDLQLF